MSWNQRLTLLQNNFPTCKNVKTLSEQVESLTELSLTEKLLLWDEDFKKCTKPLSSKKPNTSIVNFSVYAFRHGKHFKEFFKAWALIEASYNLYWEHYHYLFRQMVRGEISWELAAKRLENLLHLANKAKAKMLRELRGKSGSESVARDPVKIKF